MKQLSQAERDLEALARERKIREDPERLKRVKALAIKKLNQKSGDVATSPGFGKVTQGNGPQEELRPAEENQTAAIKLVTPTLPEIESKNEPAKPDSMAGSRPKPKAAPDANLPEVVTAVESSIEPELGASPQAEDGHIDIANEIAEALANKINLSSYESRVLWALFRKTYGWHKKTDQISITQFQEITGMKRRHVHRTLSKLVQKKVVTRIGNSRIVTYGFQKDYTKWRNITQIGNDVGIPRVCGQGRKKIVTQIGNRSLPKQVTTKETIQKKFNILSDEEWTDRIKKLNPWINWDDLNREMDTWLLNNPKRQKTRKFITNWILNKQKDKPMEKKKSW